MKTLSTALNCRFVKMCKTLPFAEVLTGLKTSCFKEICIYRWKFEWFGYRVEAGHQFMTKPHDSAKYCNNHFIRKVDNLQNTLDRTCVTPSISPRSLER